MGKKKNFMPLNFYISVLHGRTAPYRIKITFFMVIGNEIPKNGQF